MRVSLTSLVRLAGVVGMAFTLAAIGLGRAAPRAPGVRFVTAPRYVGVNGVTFEPPTAESYLLDTGAGCLVPIEPVGGVLIDHAGCSPWLDDRGDHEIVGRATERSESAGGLYTGLGLVRLRAVGPQSLYLAPANPVVTGRPCWVPGSASRVLFPAGDGNLYAQDFAGPGVGAEDNSPRPVAWGCPRPGGGAIRVEDPAAPGLPALGGRLLVALSHSSGARRSDRFGPPEIWWLKLDPGGQVVLGAGRLVTPGGPTERTRLPCACVAADGRVVLAFLWNHEGDRDWRLRIARIEVDPLKGDPLVDPAGVRDLGGRFSMNPPSFSTDGQWVFGIPREQPPVKTIRRLPVLASLAPTGASR